METVKLEHFIYGPTPKKGYSVRAKSQSFSTQEYKDISKGFYVPLDPALLKTQDHEARIVISAPQRDLIFFVRIFKREKLDEKGRSGIISHGVRIPKSLFSEGLAFKDIEKSLTDFEKSNRIPVGDLNPLEIAYQKIEERSDPDTADMPSLISKESLNKIINTFTDKPETKVFLVHKKSDPVYRMNLAIALSKTLDVNLRVAPLLIITEPPLPLITEILFNVIVSSMMIPLKTNAGWIVVKPFQEEQTTYKEVDRAKIDETLKKIYG